MEIEQCQVKYESRGSMRHIKHRISMIAVLFRFGFFGVFFLGFGLFFGLFSGFFLVSRPSPKTVQHFKS